MKLRSLILAMAGLIYMSAPTASEPVSFDVTVFSNEPVTLVGDLAKPSGSGPFAAVVMLHGCGGMTPRWGDAWSERLVSWGYVALQVDSFRPRGRDKGVCSEPYAVGPQERGADAHAAKAYLATLPYIDKARIAVLGMSHGGWSTLWAVQNTHINEAVRVDPFKAAVTLYPYCLNTMTRLDAPLLILIGEGDDWTPSYRCEAMKAEGPTRHKVVLKIYPGASHTFDIAGRDLVYQGHVLKYDPVATKDAVARTKAFLARHLGDG